jgi:hypothetical protein
VTDEVGTTSVKGHRPDAVDVLGYLSRVLC